MFGRRKVPYGASAAPQPQSAPQSYKPAWMPPPPAPDSDGRRRVIGEEVYAEHKAMLDAIGFDINDRRNVLPEPEDLDAWIKESLAKQEERRCAIEADMLARHGVNNIRPFFVLAEPIYNSKIGSWLMRTHNLMPYDEWNLVYLPVDEATQRVMPGMPLHPLQSIGPIDDLMIQKIGPMYENHLEAVEGAKRAMPNGYDEAVAGRLLDFQERQREALLDYVAELKPLLVRMIGEIQEQQAA